MGEDSAQSPPFTSEDILRENVSANSARLIPEAIASNPRDRSLEGRPTPNFSFKGPGKLIGSRQALLCRNAYRRWLRSGICMYMQNVPLHPQTIVDRRSTPDSNRYRIKNAEFHPWVFSHSQEVSLVALNDYGICKIGRDDWKLIFCVTGVTSRNKRKLHVEFFLQSFKVNIIQSNTVSLQELTEIISTFLVSRVQN